MRIIITTISYYPDFPSGAARLAFDEAVFLSRAGHEVWVVTEDFSGVKPECSFEDGIHVLRYAPPRLKQFDPRRIWVHQKLTQSLISRYIRSSIDVVHGHSLLQYEGLVKFYDKTVRKSYSVHSPVRMEMQSSSRGAPLLRRSGMLIAGRITQIIESKCLNASSCVTAFSEYTKKMLSRLHGDHILSKVQVIPGWVDINKFKIIHNRSAVKSQLGWPVDVPLLFTIRRLVPRMGLDKLAYALREVKGLGKSFYLIIGGQGPLRTDLETLINKLGLSANVKFVGLVPEDVLPVMYGAADAFVLPTAELECFGLIILEALACGTPVLATPVGAIPEILGRFEKEWLSRGNSIRALSELICAFLQGDLPTHDPNELRKKVGDYYSRDLVLPKLITSVIGK